MITQRTRGRPMAGEVLQVKRMGPAPLNPNDVNPNSPSHRSVSTEPSTPNSAGNNSNASGGGRFSGVTPVRYPGYNPNGPYTWPSPTASEPISQRKIIAEVLRCNGHTIAHYGVRKDITAFALSVPMQLFAMDAFWWIFLQNFSNVDFDSLAERTRRNVLVSESDVMTYMNFGGQAMQPKRPLKKQLPVSGRSEAGRLPQHLCHVRGRLRGAGDVAAIGTPLLRSSSSSSSLADCVDNLVGVAHDDDDVSSIASSLEYSPRSDVSSGTKRSDLSGASAATVDGILRVTHFSMTFPALTKMVPEVLQSVVAREQHQLFTRMAAHYAQAVQRTAHKHHTIKDAITRLLPDILAQALFAGFWQGIPYASQLFDLPFQRDLAKLLSFWIGGVERSQNPRSWPVHHLLNTVYKKGKGMNSANPTKKLGATMSMRHAKDSHLKRMQSSKRLGSTGSASNSTTALPTPQRTPAPRSSSLKKNSTSNPGLLSLPGDLLQSVNVPDSDRPNAQPPDKTDKPQTARSLVPKPPAAGGASTVRTRAVEILPPAHVIPSTLSFKELDDVEEYLLTPDQRRARAVEIEVAEMKQELIRLTTTHTFSQLHYQTNAKGRAEGMNVGAPLRNANVYQVGPQKRTVQVIKADLDAKYIESAPWYGNPKSKTRIREQTGIAKFALANWSPLLHRFMLSNGAENRNNADSIKWTT